MDSTYAPQSPDLSSFLSSPPKTQQPYNSQPHPQPQSSSYAPRSPGVPSFNTQQGNLNAFASNQNQFAFATDGASDFAEYGSNSYMPPIPALPTSHSDFHAQSQIQNLNQLPNQTSILDSHSSSAYGRPHRQARNNIASYSDDFEPPEQSWEQDQGQYISSPQQVQGQYQQQYPHLQQQQTHPHAQQSMSSRGPRIKPDPSTASMHNLPSAEPPTYNNPNPLNIEIRTKFPVARIKRIMQADEEVGKVAQVTPVAVSKALELFMIALVGGAADKAREKGGKKVTAQHLKSVVLGSEQFDFLAEIVGRVAEVQEGAGGEGRKRKGKEEKDSESSEEEKKPKKGRGRRKKGEE